MRRSLTAATILLKEQIRLCFCPFCSNSHPAFWTIVLLVFSHCFQISSGLGILASWKLAPRLRVRNTTEGILIFLSKWTLTNTCSFQVFWNFSFHPWVLLFWGIPSLSHPAWYWSVVFCFRLFWRRRWDLPFFFWVICFSIW